MATGLKLRMRGYRSMGDSVPLVMTTVWNFWNTGFTARLASRQLSCRAHRETLWCLEFSKYGLQCQARVQAAQLPCPSGETLVSGTFPNAGFTARLASRQLSCRAHRETLWCLELSKYGLHRQARVQAAQLPRPSGDTLVSGIFQIRASPPGSRPGSSAAAPIGRNFVVYKYLSTGFIARLASRQLSCPAHREKVLR